MNVGMIIESTPEMGEYHVEVRRESFYISGSPNFVWRRVVKGKEEVSDSQTRPRGKGWETAYVERRHAIFLYRDGDVRQGTAEILIEDVPKIRAALDEVERYVQERSGGRRS